MPTLLAMNFGRGEPEALEKQGPKNRRKKSPSKFAEKFAGNFPKMRQANLKPQIRSAEPRDQQIAASTAEKWAKLVHSAEDPRKLLLRKPAPA